MENTSFQLAAVTTRPTVTRPFMTIAQTVLLILLLIITGLCADIHFGIINPVGDLMSSV